MSIKKIIGLLTLLVPSLVMASGRPSFKPKIEVEHRYLNSTSLQNQGGEFAFGADKLEVSNIFASLSYERWRLNWKEIDQLPFGDGQNAPVDQMHSVRLGGRYMHKWSDNIRWLSSVGLGMTYEEQTHDAMSLSLFTMWIRQLEDGWAVSYGAAVSYHPVHSRFLPVAGFSYRMREPLGWSGLLGYPRSYIGYGFTPQWQLSGGMVNNSIMAKLAEDSQIAADGYGEINAWQADVALKYQPVEHWSVTSSLRFSPLYEFTVFDADGNKQDTYTMLPTWGAALALSYQF